MDTGSLLVQAINRNPDEQSVRGAFSDWCQEQGKTAAILKRYYVVTPEYPSGCGYDEPPEWGADVIEVEARTRREAVRIGVKEMLRIGGRQYRWVHDQRGNGQNPFAGVKAHEDKEGEQE